MALRFIRIVCFSTSSLLKTAGRSRPLSTSSILRCAKTDQGDSSPQNEQQTSEESTEEPHMEEEIPESEVRQRLLDAALEFVPSHGWSVEALAEAAQTEGLPAVSHGMFPRGGGDLALHFVGICNSQLAEQMAQETEQVEEGHVERRHTREFLKDAMETRLRMIVPYVDNWPQAMSLLAQPNCAPDSLKLLSSLVDDMWYHAGDRSADFNWYTKRVTLAGVYTSAQLVLVRDQSPDFQDTWQFIDSRLDNLEQFGKAVRGVAPTVESLAQGLSGAYLTIRNITGFNVRNR
ncbi:ubiquinone biosynthesis protein COQ9, mitochondrial-like [Branchiostoma lanceolatum]|uniref:ubiquinone biosynthesis protein COQ9, mitochondrial-like n=1 Tax=Branchiostoma lanceolatum TaxID=7740 RepID=UPI003454DC50